MTTPLCSCRVVVSDPVLLIFHGVLLCITSMKSQCLKLRPQEPHCEPKPSEPAGPRGDSASAIAVARSCYKPVMGFPVVVVVQSTPRLRLSSNYSASFFGPGASGFENLGGGDNALLS